MFLKGLDDLYGQLRMCAAKLHLIYQNTEAPLQKCKFFKQINRFEKAVRVRFNPGFNLLNGSAGTQCLKWRMPVKTIAIFCWSQKFTES
jgi:hypothetical protein